MPDTRTDDAPRTVGRTPGIAERAARDIQSQRAGVVPHFEQVLAPGRVAVYEAEAGIGHRGRAAEIPQLDIAFAGRIAETADGAVGDGQVRYVLAVDADLSATGPAVAVDIQVGEGRGRHAAHIDRSLGSAVECRRIDVVHRAVAAVGIGEVHVRQGNVAGRGKQRALHGVLDGTAGPRTCTGSRDGERAGAGVVEHDAVGAAVLVDVVEGDVIRADSRAADG